MKLHDYIHYYLGCKIQKDSDALDYPTIEGVHGDNVIISEYSYRTPNCDKVFVRPMIWHSISFIKPILRRLEDMTEEEAAHLALIYSGAKKVVPTKGVAANWHYFFCYFGEETEAETLIISADGCAWYAHYFDKSQSGCRNIVNEHFATHYLLQQHFDLFGLIDAGLAVDAKTTNS